MEQVNLNIPYIYNKLLEQNIKCEKCLNIKIENKYPFIGCGCFTNSFLTQSSGIYIYSRPFGVNISTYSFNVLNGMSEDFEDFNYTEIYIKYINNVFVFDTDDLNKKMQDLLDFKSNDIIESILFVKKTFEKLLENSIFI